MLFTPNEDNINEANKLSWNIGPFRDAEFKFHDSHPLMILWKFTVQVRRTDDATGKPDLTKPLIDIDMSPEKMGCWPWPATGATGYFSKVRTSYNGFVTNDTEVLHCINLDELNTMASMDMFLNPDEADLDLSKSFGNTPLYNNYGKTREHLKNQLGYPPDLNYTNTKLKTGATGYFSKVRTSYNGFVTNDTEVLHCINLLKKLCYIRIGWVNVRCICILMISFNNCFRNFIKRIPLK
jgi:hypothetical protein